MNRVSVLVEWLDDHLHPRMRERIALADGQRSFTIGRSIDADVSLDDEHAAAAHAVVTIADDGRITVSDLGSVNGLHVAGVHYRRAEAVMLPDNTLRVGMTSLRVRSSLERLSPEKPQSVSTAGLIRSAAVLAGLGFAVVNAQTTYTIWEAAPTDLEMSMAVAIALSLCVFAGWIAIWAVLTRIIAGKWHWYHHAAIAFGLMATTSVASSAFDFGWFTLALPEWSNRSLWLYAASLSIMVSCHVLWLSARKINWRTIAAGLLVFMLASGVIALKSRFDSRNVAHIDVKRTIYPPRMRLAGGIEATQFFRTATGLRAEADTKRAALPPEDQDDNAD